MQRQYDDRGLDPLGFIKNDCAIEEIQPEFSAVVDAVVDALTKQLPNKIHSVYLYGSVARGNAIVGRSDLDVSVVFSDDISAEDKVILNEISRRIPAEHRVISKLDIDPGSLSEVLSKDEKYRWHFWLKHCCCCLWGQDLSLDFDWLQPDIRISLALNGDLAQAISQFEADPTPAQGKVIGKKILRSAYFLIAPKNGSWYNNLTKCAYVASRFYPKDKAAIQVALELARGGHVSEQQALNLCATFGEKLVKEMQVAEKSVR